MELFEIHITAADETIHEAAHKLNLKTIAVELLRSDYSVIRTEHMTSIAKKFSNFDECYNWVMSTKDELSKYCEIIRVKIECPYNKNYIKNSCYIESHFVTNRNEYAISRNIKKNEFLGTSRVYNKNKFEKFNENWKNEVVELCLYDSNPTLDYDWLSLFNTHNYKNINDLPVNPDSVLVYGSNTEARHGKGVAKIARDKWGATYGKNPTGLVGQSYGIITKDLTKKVHPSIPKSYIIEQIKILYEFAVSNKDLNFYIPYSASAKNLNAYSSDELAKMFKEAGNSPENIIFETSFFNLIKNV